MTFPGQFALSLELTRLVPAGLCAVGKAWEGAMTLARNLRGSGSDWVIEEDLVGLFGRCLIDRNMASTFTQVVHKSEPEVQLFAGVVLLSGPGPTVTRALTQASEGSYFAMIIQCSLLVSVHKREPLSAAISHAFGKEAEDAPLQEQKAVPSSEAIVGVLRAVEDQTTSFDWNGLLLAVARQLDLEDRDIHHTLPSIILQGLITILASVQRFREERVTLVELSTGVCVLVVWAHHVLGLSVIVRIYKDDRAVQTAFGLAPEQVIIDVRRHYERLNSLGELVSRPESVTLLTTDGEKLFGLTAEPDDESIDSTFRGFARGFAKRRLQNEITQTANRKTLIQELALLTLSFSALWSQRLDVLKGYKTDKYDNSSTNESSESEEYHITKKARYSPKDQENNGEIVFMPYRTSHSKLLEATRFLFDNSAITMERAKDYINLYCDLPLQNADMPIGIISKILDTWNSSGSEWAGLRLHILSLSVIVFAFAQVGDLESVSELPLYESISTIREHDLLEAVMIWDGKSPIQLSEESSFQAISELMLGGNGDLDWLNTSLISEKGWSIFLSSISEADPIHVDKGNVSIRKGVPFRNNVWKHFIVDFSWSTQQHMVFSTEAVSGDKIKLSCSRNVIPGKSYCGERGDSFVISPRFLECPPAESPETTIARRTGFNEMLGALWMSIRTQQCSHVSNNKNPITLPPGCVALSGFGDHGGLDMKAKVYVCMTARNKYARWRALLAISTMAIDRSKSIPVLLRDQDCCLQCALDQALTSPGMWFLVL